MEPTIYADPKSNDMQADKNLPHVRVTWKSGASAPRGKCRHERVGVCTLPANQSANPLTILHGAPYRLSVKVVQCDQTSPLTTSMMLCSEEVRRPLQRPVSFLPTSEVQHVNHIDCSFGAIFARWRGLGILSLARLAQSLRDERLTRCLTLFSV